MRDRRRALFQVIGGRISLHPTLFKENFDEGSHASEKSGRNSSAPFLRGALFRWGHLYYYKGGESYRQEGSWGEYNFILLGWGGLGQAKRKLSFGGWGK